MTTSQRAQHRAEKTVQHRADKTVQMQYEMTGTVYSCASHECHTPGCVQRNELIVL